MMMMGWRGLLVVLLLSILMMTNPPVSTHDVDGRQGYWYVLTPCTLGPLIMLLIALIFNNLDPTRQYPVAWDLSPFNVAFTSHAKKVLEQEKDDPAVIMAAELPACEDPREVL